MHKDEFNSDPIFADLRDFAAADLSGALPEIVRDEFRNGVRRARKGKYFWRGLFSSGLMLIAFPTLSAAKILPAPMQRIVDSVNKTITSPVEGLLRKSESVAVASTTGSSSPLLPEVSKPNKAIRQSAPEVVNPIDNQSPPVRVIPVVPKIQVEPIQDVDDDVAPPTTPPTEIQEIKGALPPPKDFAFTIPVANPTPTIPTSPTRTAVVTDSPEKTALPTPAAEPEHHRHESDHERKAKTAHGK